jgi:hypothetical protein
MRMDDSLNWELYAWNWSEVWPDYAERMAAMARHVPMAFLKADALELEPMQ